MVSGPCLNNNTMDTYKLLDLSGSDSENEMIHFTPMTGKDPPPPRKKRLKRRERDLLRVSPSHADEEAGGVCSCAGLGVGSGMCQSWRTNAGETVRSVLLVLALAGLSLLTWLALHLQSRLDATQRFVNTVEASSSELPAKFHESHVRLQELEKNQTSLWASVSQLTAALTAATKKVQQLETDVKGIKDSLSSAPQLSSLPKDVAALQESVASFGSTLQDVQSSLKVVKSDHDKLTSDVNEAATSIDRFKEDISLLKNQTFVGVGREGADRASIGETVVALRHSVAALNTSLTTINSSLTSYVNTTSDNTDKLQRMERSTQDLQNVTQRLTSLETWQQTIEPTLPSHVANLSTVVGQLQDTADLHTHTLHNLTQNMDMVKGVQGKLTGSQMTMAGGITALKQQLQKVEQQVQALSTPPPHPLNNDTHTRKQRSQADAEAIRNSRRP